MEQHIWNLLQPILGLGEDPKNLTLSQMIPRATIVFIVTLVIVRLAHKRFMARRTAFDYVLGIILASMLARAINGSAPFFGTLVLGFYLVILHRILAALSFHSDRFGCLIKGHDKVLVKDGVRDHEVMKAHRISEKDLMEDLRLESHLNDVSKVKEARLERSGEISSIEKS
jgi:uncharacterized membrane protein YcaP (DUF421 family)